MYRFPKDQVQRKTWISCVPNANLDVKDHTVICELHWPKGFETVRVHGKDRPKDPPSVWYNYL